MGTTLKDTNTDELMTVEEFARRYRVDASVVRHWAKMGHINYELVGPRKLKRIRPDTILTFIEPKTIPPMSRDAKTFADAKVTNWNEAMVAIYMRDGLDREAAEAVVSSMDQPDIIKAVQEAQQ